MILFLVKVLTASFDGNYQYPEFPNASTETSIIPVMLYSLHPIGPANLMISTQSISHDTVLPCQNESYVVPLEQYHTSQNFDSQVLPGSYTTTTQTVSHDPFLPYNNQYFIPTTEHCYASQESFDSRAHPRFYTMPPPIYARRERKKFQFKMKHKKQHSKSTEESIKKHDKSTITEVNEQDSIINPKLEEVPKQEVIPDFKSDDSSQFLNQNSSFECELTPSKDLAKIKDVIDTSVIPANISNLKTQTKPVITLEHSTNPLVSMDIPQTSVISSNKDMDLDKKDEAVALESLTYSEVLKLKSNDPTVKQKCISTRKIEEQKVKEVKKKIEPVIPITPVSDLISTKLEKSTDTKWKVILKGKAKEFTDQYVSNDTEEEITEKSIITLINKVETAINTNTDKKQCQPKKKKTKNKKNKKNKPQQTKTEEDIDKLLDEIIISFDLDSELSEKFKIRTPKKEFDKDLYITVNTSHEYVNSTFCDKTKNSDSCLFFMISSDNLLIFEEIKMLRIKLTQYFRKLSDLLVNDQTTFITYLLFIIVNFKIDLVYFSFIGNLIEVFKLHLKDYQSYLYFISYLFFTHNINQSDFEKRNENSFNNIIDEYINKFPTTKFDKINQKEYINKLLLENKKDFDSFSEWNNYFIAKFDKFEVKLPNETILMKCFLERSYLFVGKKKKK